MERMRISTTVDGERLAAARALFGRRDAEMLDRALGALIEELETQREIAALRAHPYESDPELNLPLIPSPDSPYGGAVPPHVLALAERRRAERR